MAIQFDNVKVITFPTIGTYYNSVTVNSQTVTLAGIETTVDNLQIEIDSGLTNPITISAFKFGKNCWIGSSLTNCEYDSGGTLSINAAQSGTSFKFNKIDISSINIGNNSKIIIRSDDHKLNINCDITTSTNNVITINNSGTINICCENFGILIQGPDETLTINNSGSMAINGGNGTSAINNAGALTINNSGIMTIDGNSLTGVIYNSGSMTINNSGKMTINSKLDMISNTAVNDLTTFTNSSTIEFNLENVGLQCSGQTTINITDSLFSWSSDSDFSQIFFTNSTASTWNGRTFTNNSQFQFKGTASITSYFDNYPSSITLQSGEQVFNKLENNSEKPILYELQSKGTLILQPYSSLEVSDHFELPEESTLIVSGETKINDSLIRGQSVILLSSELNGRVLNNCNCTF